MEELLGFIKSILEKFRPKEIADPVKILPKSAVDKVFSYLSFEDIKQCTLVNSDWNKFIGNSSQIDRFRICICEPYNGMVWRFTSEEANIFERSDRNYKHISMFVTRNMTKDHFLLLASFKWKSLKLCHHIFKSDIDMVNFFGLFEPTVVDLDLRHVKIVFSRPRTVTDANFIFPNLKTLRLQFCYAYLFSEIFKNIDQVEKLEIETGPQPLYDSSEKNFIDKIKAIQQIFLRNTRLKKLSLFLHQNDFDNIFIDQRFLSRIGFSLDSLKTKNFSKLSGRDTNIVQVTNFGHFLLSQRQTLERLHLLKWMGNEVLETIINSLDRLSVLVIAELDCYGKFDDSIANINFYRNESLKTLKLFGKVPFCNDLQKAILEFVPNLRHLTVDTMNQEILEKLIDVTLKIETIEVNTFSAYFPPQDASVLESLRKIKINHSFSRSFKDILRDHDCYTNFEQVFLKAVKVFEEKEERQR